VTENDSLPAESAALESAGKRVSWVELYFDLIFVVAVSQTAHVIVTRPTRPGVAIALGLFATLWWTWIGFVVLYNRHVEDRPSRRLFVLAGTLPCAVAAVEAEGATHGDTAGFALALAAARLVLAVAYPLSAGRDSRIARRAGLGYALSTVLFAGSALLPSPWRYILWAVALIQEAGFLLLADVRRRDVARRRTRRPRAEPRPSRADSMQQIMAAPQDPEQRLDTPHLAERFGLFMIILLGEIVVSVAAAAMGMPQHNASFWVGLLGGLVLAAALWWIYFDSSASINEYVLEAAGGNPAFAYGIYAAGHFGPAFALLAIAAGVNLSLHENPPAAAAWLLSAGLALYLVGTRVFLMTDGHRFGRLLRLLVVAATVCLALLRLVLPSWAVVAVVTVWAIGVALAVSRAGPSLLRRIAADPLSIFRNA
jgi:low temperature requirement protein LtrA